MINCLQTRSGDIHVIGVSRYGKHYTICGKEYSKKEYIIFSLDNMVSDVCPNCHYQIENDNTDVRSYRSHILDFVMDRYDGIQYQWDSPKEKYISLLKRRYWGKAKRMRIRFPKR